MKQGDKLFKIRAISGIVDVVEILSTEPENETLIQVVDFESKNKRFINKAHLDRWRPVELGIQIELFRKDMREDYLKRYRRYGDRLWK